MGAVSLRDAVAGIRMHPVPNGVEALGVSPLCRAIERFGAPVPLSVLYACNLVSPKRLAAMRAAERKADVASRAASQRRVREDMRAIAADASWLWGRAAGVPPEPLPGVGATAAYQQAGGGVSADRGRSRAENA